MLCSWCFSTRIKLFFFSGNHLEAHARYMRAYLSLRLSGGTKFLRMGPRASLDGTSRFTGWIGPCQKPNAPDQKNPPVYLKQCVRWTWSVRSSSSSASALPCSLMTFLAWSRLITHLGMKNFPLSGQNSRINSALSVDSRTSFARLKACGVHSHLSQSYGRRSLIFFFDRIYVGTVSRYGRRGSPRHAPSEALSGLPCDPRGVLLGGVVQLGELGGRPEAQQCVALCVRRGGKRAVQV